MVIKVTNGSLSVMHLWQRYPTRRIIPLRVETMRTIKELLRLEIIFDKLDCVHGSLDILRAIHWLIRMVIYAAIILLRFALMVGRRRGTRERLVSCDLDPGAAPMAAFQRF